MATTTPNYGWTVPTSTDLVKDGATAIETLGDAIDASMNTALGTKKAGMVLLNTTSFSGVTSVSLAADTFTSTYTDYFFKVDMTTAGSGEPNVRLRASGTDASGSNYAYQFLRAQSSSVDAGAATTTNAVICPVDGGVSGSRYTLQLEIFSPKEAVPTRIYSRYLCTKPGNGVSTINHTLSTAYDSLSLLNSSNMTGTYSIYGFNK